MIITINQAQIETAITNYVNSKMVIADTQRLDIDLKATRGSEGYTAVIEVVDIDAPRAVQAVEEIRPSIRETLRQVRAETVTPTAVAEEEAAPEPATETPAPVRKGPSLFSKHTRISNAPAEEVAEADADHEDA